MATRENYRYTNSQRQYQVLADFSGGMDTRNADSTIPDKYARDVTNFNIEQGGVLSKRRGVQAAVLYDRVINAFKNLTAPVLLTVAQVQHMEVLWSDVFVSTQYNIVLLYLVVRERPYVITIAYRQDNSIQCLTIFDFYQQLKSFDPHDPRYRPDPTLDNPFFEAPKVTTLGAYNYLQWTYNYHFQTTPLPTQPPQYGQKSVLLLCYFDLFYHQWGVISEHTQPIGGLTQTVSPWLNPALTSDQAVTTESWLKLLSGNKAPVGAVLQTINEVNTVITNTQFHIPERNPIPLATQSGGTYNFVPNPHYWDLFPGSAVNLPLVTAVGIFQVPDYKFLKFITKLVPDNTFTIDVIRNYWHTANEVKFRWHFNKRFMTPEQFPNGQPWETAMDDLLRWHFPWLWPVDPLTVDYPNRQPSTLISLTPHPNVVPWYEPNPSGNSRQWFIYLPFTSDPKFATKYPHFPCRLPLDFNVRMEVGDDGWEGTMRFATPNDPDNPQKGFVEGLDSSYAPEVVSKPTKRTGEDGYDQAHFVVHNTTTGTDEVYTPTYGVPNNFLDLPLNISRYTSMVPGCGFNIVAKPGVDPFAPEGPSPICRYGWTGNLYFPLGVRNENPDPYSPLTFDVNYSTLNQNTLGAINKKWPRFVFLNGMNIGLETRGNDNTPRYVYDEQGHFNWDNFVGLFKRISGTQTFNYTPTIGAFRYVETSDYQVALTSAAYWGTHLAFKGLLNCMTYEARWGYLWTSISTVTNFTENLFSWLVPPDAAGGGKNVGNKLLGDDTGVLPAVGAPTTNPISDARKWDYLTQVHFSYGPPDGDPTKNVNLPKLPNTYRPDPTFFREFSYNLLTLHNITSLDEITVDNVDEHIDFGEVQSDIDELIKPTLINHIRPLLNTGLNYLTGVRKHNADTGKTEWDNTYKLKYSLYTAREWTALQTKYEKFEDYYKAVVFKAKDISQPKTPNRPASFSVNLPAYDEYVVVIYATKLAWDYTDKPKQPPTNVHDTSDYKAVLLNVVPSPLYTENYTPGLLLKLFSQTSKSFTYDNQWFMYGNSNTFFVSAVNKVNYFPLANFEVLPGDQPIKRIVAFKNRMIIFTPTEVYLWEGTTPQKAKIVPIIQQKGVVAPYTASPYFNQVMYLSPDGVYAAKPVVGLQIEGQMNIAKMDTAISKGVRPPDLPIDPLASAVVYRNRYYIHTPSTKTVWVYYNEPNIRGWVRHHSPLFEFQRLFNVNNRLCYIGRYGLNIYFDRDDQYDPVVQEGTWFVDHDQYGNSTVVSSTYMSKGLVYGLPNHTKKFRSLQVAFDNTPEHVALFCTVWVDGTKVVDTKADEVSYVFPSVTSNSVEVANVGSIPQTYLSKSPQKVGGLMDWSVLSNQTNALHAVPLRVKGRSIQFYVRHSENKLVNIRNFAVPLRPKRPRPQISYKPPANIGYN